jgi:hypothetical protein
VQLHGGVLPGSVFGERALHALKPGDEVALELRQRWRRCDRDLRGGDEASA